MNASQIALKTQLSRGSVKYRLRKLRYNTGQGIQYEPNVWREVLNFEKHVVHRRAVDYFMEYEVYFYWKENKNNSVTDIALHFNIAYGKVEHILRRVFKNKCVTVESKINHQ